MKKGMKLTAVLMVLLAVFMFTACDGSSSDELFDGDNGGDGPTPPPVPAPVTYTISFDANGGTDTMDPVSVEEGNDCIIPANAFIAPAVPDGAIPRTFRCWTTNKDGSGTAFSAGAEIPKVTSDITLYAQWTKPLFSVSADKKVYFAQGNLQATIDESGVPTAWKFAANQYDCLGEGGANQTIGSVAGDVDLFGWSTDATYNNWGIHIKNDTTTDYTNGNFMDWGKAIGDGNTWRTLTKDEWTYLLNTNGDTAKYREDANRFAKACVNEVKGLLIFPDGYTLPGDYTADGGTGMAEVNALGTEESPIAFPTKKIPDDTWTAMEAAGVVFLPVAGYRCGSSVGSVGVDGNYWSATDYDGSGATPGTAAYKLNFYTTGVKTAVAYFRNYGYSVRLVCGE